MTSALLVYIANLRQKETSALLKRLFNHLGRYTLQLMQNASVKELTPIMKLKDGIALFLAAMYWANRDLDPAMSIGINQ